ncbi:harmonin-like [Oscarella lobularis]|uniref:harmonin-like n=1 Tax=Oscarella lobularis TaxID=121494 RepID=UPI003313E82C
MNSTPEPSAPDKKRAAKEFKAKVVKVIDDEGDRDALFEALRDYQGTWAIDSLMTTLEQILNEPNRLQLYSVIRDLIPPRDQEAFDELAPVVPSGVIRKVHVSHNGHEPLGFTVTGGMEYKLGFYVTDVQQPSKASAAGIMTGDCLISLNGCDISSLTHKEVIQFIKNKRELALYLKTGGLIPEQGSKDEPISWKTLKKDDVQTKERKNSVVREMHARDPTALGTDERRVQMHVESGKPIGCSLRGGIQHKMGIFVADVQPGTLADKVGLQNGDQILSVNDISFLRIAHAQAIAVIKSSPFLIMTVKSPKHTKPREPAEPLNPNITFGLPDQQKRKEKEKEEEPLSLPPIKKAAPGLALGSGFSAEAFPDLDNVDFSKHYGSVRESIYSLGSDDYDHVSTAEVERRRISRKSSAASMRRVTQNFDEEILNGREAQEYHILKMGPLGISIEGGKDRGGPVKIHSLDPDGIIAQQSTILPGMEILKINEHSLVHVTHEEAVAILKETEENDEDEIDVTIATSNIEH